MDKDSPYIRELLAMFTKNPGAFKGKVTGVHVYHSNDCSIFKGGKCDCSPDVIMDKPEPGKDDNDDTE